MVDFELFVNLPSRTKQSPVTTIKENWRGLYQKDRQYTYPEATLIVSKGRRK